MKYLVDLPPDRLDLVQIIRDHVLGFDSEAKIVQVGQVLEISVATGVAGYVVSFLQEEYALTVRLS